MTQDSQTITSDERLREAAQAVVKLADEFDTWIALGGALRSGSTFPNHAKAVRAMDALRAALNQGQDSQTLTADERALDALEVLHTFSRDRGHGELRTRHNAEMDQHMRTILAALNQGQGND